ncbi:Hypothetical protein I5071_74150 [Sandaracinus amylolyticus]|nr:Hypothetical protein I5071_74150 [Sandaracinus amylolyticus]
MQRSHLDEQSRIDRTIPGNRRCARERLRRAADREHVGVGHGRPQPSRCTLIVEPLEDEGWIVGGLQCSSLPAQINSPDYDDSGVYLPAVSLTAEFTCRVTR